MICCLLAAAIIAFWKQLGRDVMARLRGRTVEDEPIPVPTPRIEVTPAPEPSGHGDLVGVGS
ncbi:MAG: hypothetical protein KY469_20700 [Actinobacteria bacterium]|nr:hypothetical protein [Actinomycetota bacterium]